MNEAMRWLLKVVIWLQLFGVVTNLMAWIVGLPLRPYPYWRQACDGALIAFLLFANALFANAEREGSASCLICGFVRPFVVTHEASGVGVCQRCAQNARAPERLSAEYPLVLVRWDGEQPYAVMTRAEFERLEARMPLPPAPTEDDGLAHPTRGGRAAMNYMSDAEIAESCESAAVALGAVHPSGMGASLAVSQAEDVLQWAAKRLAARDAAFRQLLDLMADMQRASVLVDESDGPQEYQTRLMALAMSARRFLRQADIQASPGSPPEEKQ